MTIINGLRYEFNEESKTATVYAPESNIKNVFIPRSVSFNSNDYVITVFDIDSFSDNKSIESIDFAKDSELKFLSIIKSDFETINVPENVTNLFFYECKNLKTINVPDNVTELSFHECDSLKTINFSKNSKMAKLQKQLLCGNSITDFEIPSNVSEIEDEWNLTETLTHVTVSPYNKNLILYDNKMILGKSQINDNVFDVLYFVNKDVDEIIIPSSVTRIASDAFANCTKLSSIKISNDSKLVSIGNRAFAKTKISSLSIPSKVTNLQEEWCKDLDYLTHIFLSPENKNFMYLDNKLLLGKSDPRKDKYDIILFSNRDIDHIFIQSSITKICKYSFQKCKKLKLIEFAQNSQLEFIEDYAFSFVPVEKIIIPDNVKSIEYNSFSDCKDIQIVEFSENSKIKEVQCYAFRGSRIQQIIIPFSIFKVFHDCYITAATLEITGENIKFPDFCELLNGIGQISLPNAIDISIEDWNENNPPLIIQKNANIQVSKYDSELLKIFYMPFNIESNLIDSLLENKKELGSGATSVVYKVNNFMTNKGFLALKIIKKEICIKKTSSKNVWNEEEDENDKQGSKYDIEKIKRYAGEYKILGMLNHPNIIKAIGFFDGDQNNSPAILLEYCRFNLRDAIHHLKDFELICIIYEICTSMKYIHAKNIIHRDLKLENILINKEKHVKICDFGISTLIDSYTQTTYTHGIGTALFMAPELFKKNVKYDNKVDVYAFGVIMYFILTKGEFPEGEIGHLSRASIPSSINELSRNIIQLCWSESADDRPSFADIIEEIERNDYKIVDGIDGMKPSIEEHLNIVDHRNGKCLLI